MTQPRPNLLCTVGLSLFAALRSLPDTEPAHAGWLSKQPPPDQGALDWATIRGVSDAFHGRDWGALADGLRALPMGARIAGAELNSIWKLLEQQLVEPVRLWLYHSDTQEGEQTAQVLARLLRGSFSEVGASRVAGLTDSSTGRFQAGLRELARLLAEPIRRYGSASCAMNATGGYKAQIALAVVIGQAMHVPVYYLFERFPEIIPFPPLPVQLDYSLWAENADLFTRLAGGAAIAPAGELGAVAARLDALLVSEEIDGETHYALSPLGEVLHNAADLHFATAPELPPAAENEKKQPRLEQSGQMRARKPLLALLKRITGEVPFVLQCATTYSNPDLPGRTGFRLRAGEVEGIWSDGTETVRFNVATTASNDAERQTAVARLQQWLERSR